MYLWPRVLVVALSCTCRAGRSPVYADRRGARIGARSRSHYALHSTTGTARRAVLSAGTHDHRQPGIRGPALSALDHLLSLRRLIQPQSHSAQGIRPTTIKLLSAVAMQAYRPLRQNTWPSHTGEAPPLSIRRRLFSTWTGSRDLSQWAVGLQ